ncbi:hypothetical protein OnM2_007007 [Erysiphe neolycopersici]|uniref:Uncharacterized protein n=1 Tax=Erysiphe neolycopersici TaxID=212602 RepID=A0A420I749_9PEZI|nr:hypothetical protein OnM2_007007 [Erysiphe neolycopersici]
MSDENESQHEVWTKKLVGKKIGDKHDDTTFDRADLPKVHRILDPSRPRTLDIRPDSYERRSSSHHTSKPSYTEKPLFCGQSWDKSGMILGTGRKVSNPESYENQGSELGVFSSNSNAGQVNRMNSNKVKLSDAYNQVVEEKTPHSPIDSDVSKKNTSIETPSRIPTPTLRRAKNLSKSSAEDSIRPGRQMNGRSQDFRFTTNFEYESDGPMDYFDGSPSPATKTAPQRTRNIKRTHSLSTGAHFTGQTAQENIEIQSFKFQSDQRKKQTLLSKTNAMFRGKNSSRKLSETPKNTTNKITKQNTPQTAAQKKASPSNPVVYSKALNKSQTFEKIFNKELPHGSGDMVNAMDSIGHKPHPSVSPISYDKGSESTTSMRVDPFENQKWEDSIEFTSDNLTSSPKLKTCEKRLETDSNSDTNNASNTQPEYFKNSSSRETIANREYSPKLTAITPPTSPSKNSSPRQDSEIKEIFKYRGTAKLGDMTNGSIYKGLQNTSSDNEVFETSQNIPREFLNEQTNKDVELKPNLLILNAVNLSETKRKKQSTSFAETQSLTDSSQKKSEKLSFNSKTEKHKKSKPITYSHDTCHLINSEEKMEPEDIRKLPFDVDPEERIAAEARLSVPQVADNRSEVNSTSAASPKQLIPTKKGENDETPRLDSKILPIETPKVVGAYIETPSSFSNLEKNHTKFFRRRALSLEIQDCKQGININTKRTRLPYHNSSLKSHLNKGLSGCSSAPNVINTAHRITASEDLRLIKKEENIQDNDTDSFIDEFLNINENNDELIVKLRNDIFLNPELGHARSNLSQVKSERFVVDLMMERMKQKLDSASHSFHDLKDGLERLEQQVAPTSRFDKATTTAECCKHKNDNNALPISSLVSSWLYIRVPSSGPQEPTRLVRDRNWKFTWLGLTFLIFSLWYVAELAMCGVFCHPKYSNKNTWQPSDPFFPWAIPTKLDHWTGRFISGRIETSLNWFHHSTRTPHWPTHLYSSNDWWEGRSGPAVPDYIAIASPHFGAANPGFGVENIDDDEILK